MTSTRVDQAWPTTINNENIRWESVKTEEEEYLDKLQSQLKRVMSHAADETFAKHNAHVRNEGDSAIDAQSINIGDDHNDENNGSDNRDVNSPVVDDEGLHLLYDQRPNCDLVTTKDGTVSSISDPHKPSDVNVEDSEQGNSQNSDTVPRTQASTLTRPRLVRFHSRVRITSGIRDISASSSACESASSSISVPLRGSRTQESRPALTGHPTASLTEMLTTDATNAWLNGLSTVRRAKRHRPAKSTGTVATASPQRQVNDSSTPSERTALLARVYSYSEPTETDFDTELDRIRTAARKTEEEVMFGKWPWRLFNRYWWWWRIEPIICCCERFDDESDSDN